MKMEKISGSEKVIPCELCLIAAGFLGSQECLYEAFDVDVTARTNIDADDITYKTSQEKVFAAGDARRGQSLVVWAIREGRECAKAVDKYLMGYSNL